MNNQVADIKYEIRKLANKKTAEHSHERLDPVLGKVQLMDSGHDACFLFGNPWRICHRSFSL